MPWRPQPDRVLAHERVVAWWEHFGFTVVQADSRPGSPFSLCEARNNAVADADADIVIVADADTIPDIASVLAAVHNPVGVTWPFGEYRHVPAEWVSKSDLMAAPVERVYTNSVGGLFVCTRETYWALGGMDEKLARRWGYEDSCFRIVAETLSTLHRLPGIVYSFQHDADRDLTDANPNKHRFALYRCAAGNPDMIRELIK